MPSLGSYLLGAAQLALLALSLGYSAYLLRRKLLPAWQGAPARLVEIVVALALLVWLSQVLGTFHVLYAGALVAAGVLVMVAIALWPAGPVAAGDPPPPAVAKASSGAVPPTAPPAGERKWSLVVMTGVVAAVVADWGITAKNALDRGIFNFDSLWYHQPFAAEMFQSHATTGLHHTETVFANWFYPQNSELVHAVGMLLTGRDTLSLFVNFGFLGIALLAAWCVGRPYGKGALSVVAAAIVLDAHTLVVREPGAGKNDLMAAALLLAAVAVLVTLWNQRDTGDKEGGGLDPGWGLAAAGLAVGLAAGTKVTVLAMAAALSVAVLVLAPAGRRWAAAVWWFVPALLGGGYWYLRNLIAAGNPIPEIERLGPISLPHPEHLQSGRPDFTIAHYLTDTGIWSEYFEPGLHTAFGALWPLVVCGAVVAALLALFVGRDRIVRWVGAAALIGMAAYLFTPLSAAGAEGAPVAFAINLRFVVPALLVGIVLVPLPKPFDTTRWRWALLGALVVVYLLTDRPDTFLRDPDRSFALMLALFVVLIPAALLVAASEDIPRIVPLSGFVTLAVAIVAIGYPVQQQYLEDRFANDGPPSEWLPGWSLSAGYRWARDVEDARIGLAGTSAGFAGYGFYGADLSNEVIYLGAKGRRGAFNALPSCASFRAAADDADLDFLVTAPFLNFLHPSEPIASPETRWLAGEDAVEPFLQEGPVTVWRVNGRLDPSGCGPANAPLREVPNTPGA